MIELAVDGWGADEFRVVAGCLSSNDGKDDEDEEGDEDREGDEEAGPQIILLVASMPVICSPEPQYWPASTEPDDVDWAMQDSTREVPS